MGDGWNFSLAFAGYGDDIVYLSQSKRPHVQGGPGDDIVYAHPFEDTEADAIVGNLIYLEEGDDIAYGNHKITMSQVIEGNEGNDKIVGGDEVGATQLMSGGDGNDFVYGGDNSMTNQFLYGDYHARQKSAEARGSEDWWPQDPALGGNDKLFSGDAGALLRMAGGPYDDKIFTGNDFTGAQKIYGDKADNDGTFKTLEPDSNDMMPLVEYPDTFNKYDGNDIIDIGDNNMDVGVYGQGGNDKIIGGYGDDQFDRLFGGSGDDKIWMINPN